MGKIPISFIAFEQAIAAVGNVLPVMRDWPRVRVEPFACSRPDRQLRRCNTGGGEASKLNSTSVLRAIWSSLKMNAVTGFSSTPRST